MGFLGMYDGATGASMWQRSYSETSTLTSVAAHGHRLDIAYVSGLFKGVAADVLGAGTLLTSSSDGDKDDAFVAMLDVSSSSGPTASWVVQIGGSSGSPSVEKSGGFLYVAGSLSSASTIGTCTMSGALGGYLAKLDRATGACVWAKDTPPNRRAISDGVHVWTVHTASSPLTFDATHTVASAGKETDVFMAKYQASDGTGLWATAIGGTGDDVADDAAMTPFGPVFSGSSQSETLSLGNLTVDNLQHKQAEALLGFDPDTSYAGNAAQRALLVVMVATDDVTPPCLSCPSGELTASDTAIAPGNCYAHGECVADGAPSRANSPAYSCFTCDSATSQTELSGPDTTNHCYFDDICHPKGERAKGYNWRNEASVCEWCDPAVSTTGYTLKSGYAFDSSFARNHKPEANSFGLIFADWANGCQALPDINLPADKSVALTTALVNPTSGAVSDVAARAASAISAITTATAVNQGAEVAWAWYHADSETCTKSGDTCQYTPAAAADTMGAAFETSLHYGQSISRVKVQQGIVLLQQQLNGASGDSTSEVYAADLKKDIIAHLLIPYYQGAIRSSYEMDAGGDTATSRADGAAYWKVIEDAVGSSFNTADRDRLSNMFDITAPASTDNYCTASTLLLRNLPAASQLQYSGSHATGTVSASATDATVHVTEADIGTLTASRTPPSSDGMAKVCTEVCAFSSPSCPSWESEAIAAGWAPPSLRFSTCSAAHAASDDHGRRLTQVPKKRRPTLQVLDGASFKPDPRFQASSKPASSQAVA